MEVTKCSQVCAAAAGGRGLASVLEVQRRRQEGIGEGEPMYRAEFSAAAAGLVGDFAPISGPRGMKAAFWQSICSRKAR